MSNDTVQVVLTSYTFLAMDVCCFLKEEHEKVLSRLIPTITKWWGMLYSETEASVTVFSTKRVTRQMPQLRTCLMMSNASRGICRMMQSFKCHHLLSFPIMDIHAEK